MERLRTRNIELETRMRHLESMAEIKDKDAYKVSLFPPPSSFFLFFIISIIIIMMLPLFKVLVCHSQPHILLQCSQSLLCCGSHEGDCITRRNQKPILYFRSHRLPETLTASLSCM
jgi:hypothetical protein